MNTVTFPKANGIPARTGTIQCTDGFALRANQMSLEHVSMLIYSHRDHQFDLPNREAEIANHANIQPLLRALVFDAIATFTNKLLIDEEVNQNRSKST